MTVPAIAITEPRGVADADLVVLGPSLGTASAVLWERAALLLGHEFRVSSWDLPGHGASPAATAPFTVAELADGLAGAVDTLGERAVHLAGVSLGGAVGLELALRHPARVRAAALVCSGARIGEPAAWRERAALVRAQSTSALVVPSAQRWFAPGSLEREPDVTGRLLHTLQGADDESYALCCEALAGFDARDRLGEVAAPVLAVWGEHDQVTPEASARLIAEGVPDGRALGIADAGHLVPTEQPEHAASALADFFRSAR